MTVKNRIKTANTPVNPYAINSKPNPNSYIFAPYLASNHGTSASTIPPAIIEPS